MASPTQWTWVWVNSRNWWWKRGLPCCSPWGSQRVGHDWVTELTELKLLRSCLTLCYPVDCSLPVSSIHGILQARILEWVAISSSWASFQPSSWAPVFYVSCIGKWVLLPLVPPGKTSESSSKLFIQEKTKLMVEINKKALFLFLGILLEHTYFMLNSWLLLKYFTILFKKTRKDVCLEY